MSRGAAGAAMQIRDNGPASRRRHQPFGSSEAGLAGKHDGLIAVLDGKLVEYPRDVIANSFFRKFKRCGNLSVIEAGRDAFQNGALAQRKLIEPQGGVVSRARAVRLGEKASHLGEQARPRRFVSERHVVLAVELDEAGVGNEAREQSALLDR